MIVRKDLPLGVLAAQVAHAAGAGPPHPPDTHVVVLAAENEAHLRSVVDKLAKTQVRFTLVEEVDPPYEGQAMSIGVDLISDRSLIRKAVSSLPLLR